MRGAWLGKPSASRSGKMRFFQLSADGSTLRWGWKKHVLLFHVDEMVCNDDTCSITLVMTVDRDLKIKFPDRGMCAPVTVNYICEFETIPCAHGNAGLCTKDRYEACQGNFIYKYFPTYQLCETAVEVPHVNSRTGACNGRLWPMERSSLEGHVCRVGCGVSTGCWNSNPIPRITATMLCVVPDSS